VGWFSRLFKRDNEPEIEKRTLMNLRVGDMVTYELADYQVVGKITFNDRGFIWHEYQLEGGERTLWLSVEMDDDLEISVFEKIHYEIEEPIPKKLELDGITFYLDEKGTANVTGQGRNLHLTGQKVRYFDFSNEDDDVYLAVEIWGGDIEVSKGWTADEYEFSIIAGSK